MNGKKRTSIIITLMMLAMVVSYFIPANSKEAYAKSTYKYVDNYTMILDINKDRKDPDDAPFLSSAVYELSGIKGDTFKNKSDYDDNLDVWYTVKKTGKSKYDITVEQDQITKRKTTKIVLTSKKKNYKIIYKVKLDHYDSKGNIIRSNGKFEKKGSWLDGSESDDHGVDSASSKMSDNDVWCYNWAKPKNSAEQKAFDTIVNELNALCADPDATLKNHSWVKTPKSGKKDRSGQLVQEKDTDLLTLPLKTPKWMSEQRKKEIIVNLYFLDRTVYDPEYEKGEYEDEDKPYQRILDGTYQGVCGRGAMRAMRIICCTNLGIIPHVINDFDAMHSWLVVESKDRSGTKFMRGMWITANTFDMKYDINLDKDKGWYEEYDSYGADILKDKYRYVNQDVVKTLTELGCSWKKFSKDYEEVRFFNYWGGLMDILAVNDMLNFGAYCGSSKTKSYNTYRSGDGYDLEAAA